MSAMFDDPDQIVSFITDGVEWSYDPRFKPAQEGDSYSEWTVAELDAELTARGLETDGKKADKVARLEADDEANAGS